MIRTAVQSESVGKENWEGHTELDHVGILGQAVKMYEKKSAVFEGSEVRMKEAELDISHSFYMILHHL